MMDVDTFERGDAVQLTNHLMASDGVSILVPENSTGVVGAVDNLGNADEHSVRVDFMELGGSAWFKPEELKMVERFHDKIKRLQTRHDGLRDGTVAPSNANRSAEHEALDLYYEIQELYAESSGCSSPF